MCLSIEVQYLLLQMSMNVKSTMEGVLTHAIRLTVLSYAPVTMGTLWLLIH